MKVLLSWLREFAPFELNPVALAGVLSDLGTPVEEMVLLGQGLDGVVVARVLALRTHPNADKMQLVDVDAGDGEALQICCGAFNMHVGDIVPLATLGTTMPSGMIERRKLRGEWSNGMLCSSSELGLGDDQAGIRILDAGLAPGTPLAEALGIEPDVLYDLEVNPNRPDAMSVAGVARDAAAKLSLPFALPDPRVVTGGEPATEATSVEIVDGDLCGRLACSVLRGVSVGESPAWMQHRLTLLGMRPVNALVDISNYVMLELGQPNHPYDLAKVPGGGLRVRRAVEGETLVTLDGTARSLTTDDLLICDARDGAVGIAGVMGGAACEIDSDTTDVLLEMAWFKPIAISRTSRRLGLRSEASARFEKGCDPEVIDLATARFSELASEICGATQAPGSVDRRGELPDRASIPVRTARVNRLLGTNLATEQVAAHLASIGFASEPTSEAGDTSSDAGTGTDVLQVTVPPWRYDSCTEIDVVEEVARLHGYANIATTAGATSQTGRLTGRQRKRRAIRRVMTGLGLSEVLPMPFLAPGQLARCGFHADGIELANPLVAEESILRPSLLPGMVQAAAANAARRQVDVGLWEIGHVFLPARAGQALPDEREHLAALLAGPDAAAAVNLWQVLVEALALPDPALVNAAAPGMHPARAATATVAGRPVGVVGEIAPTVLAEHGIDGRVAWLEVDLGPLLDEAGRDRPFRPISRFPSSDIDLAFEVGDAVPATDVAATIRAAAGALLWSVELFDVFRGAQVGEGRRSLAYRLRLQALDRTLTDAEIAEVRRQCIDAVESSHGASLRG